MKEDSSTRWKTDSFSDASDSYSELELEDDSLPSVTLDTGVDVEVETIEEVEPLDEFDEPSERPKKRCWTMKPWLEAEVRRRSRRSGIYCGRTGDFSADRAGGARPGTGQL